MNLPQIKHHLSYILPLCELQMEQLNLDVIELFDKVNLGVSVFLIEN